MLGLVAGPVIEAIARLEFEDGLRTGVLPGGCWYPCGGCTYPMINSAPLCGCQKDPCQTKFRFCRVPRMGGIKLQLLYGVRIEPAVGCLPYLAWIPSRSLPMPLGGT